MRILFMGTPDFAVPCLEKLIKDGHNIVGVLTQPDKPQGRKMKLTPPPVKELALQNNLEVYQPESLKNDAIKQLLEDKQPELIVVVAYGKILPKYVLDFPKYGCINVHGSLLPRWRGAAPIQWSIIAGDKTAGVTTMKMAEGLDTGDMLLKYETEIAQTETAGELFDRLALNGAELLHDTIEQIDSIVPEVQDESKANYAHMLDKQMAQIDWSKSNKEIDCLIRGLNPWPVALTTLNGERLKIYSASLQNASGKAGEVLKADSKNGLLVACGEGAMLLNEIQAVGGKRMNAKDYLRGHKIEVGSILGE
ncbi:MAG TPA: methionyl-tRNA formyltransferase [Candidatus Butyricicoccus avistercoris]|uniref:Methionyl-tRNA formyltransferase n=1 Tax=Candidatus Butyricicoccus avistercoris TaxID=2838518 RepID=A0A9D1PGC7_9FIRM|nr:methionyl-tRNA formyltransferase [Candidatus Butyricicoccus avistercoris]